MRLSGVRGEVRQSLKVAINYAGGSAISMTWLTGRTPAEKADVAIRTICSVSLAEAKVLTPNSVRAARLDDAGADGDVQPTGQRRSSPCQ